MGKLAKIIESIMRGRSDSNVSFSDLTRVLESMGFQCRIKGGHHIYTRNDISEIVNIQPNGSKAKAYQVKQIRGIIAKYKLEELL